MKFNNRLTDEIYTSDTEKLGENVLQAMQNTIHQNGGIGTVTGTMMRACRSCRSANCCCII